MPKPSAGHTGTHKGKRVLVLMRDSNHFVAKFDRTDYKSRQVHFQDHDPVRLRDIRTLSIYKPGK